MVIDFHTHIFPPDLRDRRDTYVQRDATFRELYADPGAKIATAEELVEAMDEDGVGTSVVMGIGWTDHGLAGEVNDYIAEAAKEFPGRLVGFAGVNPAWGDRAVQEVERCALGGMKGIGELHPDTQGFDIADQPTMAPVMEAARHHGLIVTTHSSEPVGHAYAGKGNTTPQVLWRFIRNFPDVTVVCAHWGGGLPFYSLMPEVAEGMRNVYFDTAASPFLYTQEVFSTVARLIGAERILMGSDYPLVRAKRILRQVQGSSLTPAEKEAVTGGAASALLGI